MTPSSEGTRNESQTWPGASPQGYRCAVCGTWLRFGDVHACGGLPTYPTNNPPPAPVWNVWAVPSLPLSDADIERIARRLAELLAPPTPLEGRAE